MSPVLSEDEFDCFVSPVLQDEKLEIDQIRFSQIFHSLYISHRQPHQHHQSQEQLSNGYLNPQQKQIQKENVDKRIFSNENDVDNGLFLEQFLQRFYQQNQTDEYAGNYCTLFDFLPISNKSYSMIYLKFLNSLSVEQNLCIIPLFPERPETYNHLMKLLMNQITFFPSFNRLFQSFDKIPNNLFFFFNTSFRFALKNGYFPNGFDMMLSIVFSLQIQKTYEAIDFFFSAFISDSSILAHYLGSLASLRSINKLPTNECSVLPISYLKFIVYTNNNARLLTAHIWSFFIRAPSLTLELIDRYPEDYLIDLWTSFFINITSVHRSSNQIDLQLNVLFGFLQSSIIHPQLLSLISSLKLCQFIGDYLFDNSGTIENIESLFDERKIATLSLFLVFCRLDEEASQSFARGTQFLSNIKKIVMESNYYDILVKYVLWVLEPSSYFPMLGVMVPMTENLFSYLPRPSITFYKDIWPLMISSLMIKGFSQNSTGFYFAKIINYFINTLKNIKYTTNLEILSERQNESLSEDDKNKDFLIGLSNTEMLEKLVPLSLNNEKYFELLTLIMANFCEYSIFNKIYSLISDDRKSLLKFLITVSRLSPLVNDFLRIDSRAELKCLYMNGTIAMWVRLLKPTVEIMRFRFENNIEVVVKYDFRTFIIEQSRKTSKFIKMNANIDGWYFLCVRILPNSISLTVNLSPNAVIEYPFKQSVSMSIGSESSEFDLQSFRVFIPALNKSQVNFLFFLGPNYKEQHIDKFVLIKKTEPLFATSKGYLSAYYSQWINEIQDNQEMKFSEDFMLDYSISPPFDSIYLANRHILKRESKITTENGNNYLYIFKLSFLEKRFCFQSFFNALEAHGGISLIIHILSETILKNKELHELAFNLFSILVNKFPFVHHYFEENKVYQMIGHILWKASPDPKYILKCAMTSSLENGLNGQNIKKVSNDPNVSKVSNVSNNQNDRGIISNSCVIKYWFLGPSLMHCEFTDLIDTIIQSLGNNFKNYNSTILCNAQGFLSIVQSISNSQKHSKKFLELLMQLVLQLTNEKNVQNNAQIILSHILVYHFNPKMKLIPENSSISLISLLDQMFLIYKDINVNLELLLPMFINSPTEIKCHLFMLLMKHLRLEHYYDLLIVLNRSPFDSDFIDYIYQFSVNFILTISKEWKSMNYHFITIPLVFLSEQEKKIEHFIALCSSSLIILENIQVYSRQMFNHIFLILCNLYRSKNLSKFLEPEVGSSSTQIPPLFLYITTFVINAIFKISESQNENTSNFDYNENDCENNLVEDFIVAFSVIDNGEYSIFLLAKILEKLDDQLDDPQKVVTIKSFVVFCFNFVPSILRERYLNTPPHLRNFVLSAIHIVDTICSNEITSKFVVLIAEIAVNCKAVRVTIADDVKKCQSLLKIKERDELIEKLESTNLNLKSNSYNKVNFQKTKYQNFVNTREENDMTRFLSIYCSSIHFQTFFGVLINSMQETTNTNNNLAKYWKKVFDDIHFPGSLVHQNCPEKFRIEERSTRYQMHRILFPMNPSYDPRYSDHWEIKYSESFPDVRLTLNEVLADEIAFSHTKDIRFSAYIVHLVGVTPVRGLFTVTSEKLNFFVKGDVIEFKIKKVNSINLAEYQHQPRGFSIEDNTKNSYVFAFETSSLRDVFVELMTNEFKIKIAQHTFNKERLQELTKKWSDGVLSNFDYLLQLNHISGRSWNDLSRYPIFPWIFTDLQKSSPVRRDLRFPFFAQTESQKSACQRYYSMNKAIGESHPQHYSNYVSNVGSALYFLIRMEPITTIEIEFQGGSLDAADRTFQSIDITTSVMTNPESKSTLELVPELFFMPDVFMNINKIKFPRSPIQQHIIINEVDLPKFTKNPHFFVRFMRKALESPETSRVINEWVDLIWGIRRQGKLAEERLNCLQNIVFHFDPSLYINDLKLYKALDAQLQNCGQAPIQLFSDFHPQKKLQPTKRKLVFSKRKVEPLRSSKQNNALNMLLSTDPEIFLKVDANLKIRIKQASLELMYRNSDFAQYKFADEIGVKLMIFNGTRLLTAHFINVITLWKIVEGNRLKMISNLRGNSSEITSISLNENNIALSGHVDGKISSFCLSPIHFLRTIECEKNLPVSLINIMNDNSTFVAIQNDDSSVNNNYCISTLFTINGEMVSSIIIPDVVVECVLSSFNDGLQSNYAFLLTKRNNIVVLSMNSLSIKGEIVTKRDDIVSIKLWKNTVLLAVAKSKELLSWNLFDTNYYTKL